MRLSIHLFAISAMASLVAPLTGCGGHDFGSAIPGSVGTATGAGVKGALSIERSARRIHVTKAGAGYPVTAVPHVRVPDEAPCVDVLFTPQTPPINKGDLPVGRFGDYKDHPFNYTPPTNCPGPYAKIVLRVRFKVSAGVQFDRTGAIWVGATNIFFGTTAEPGSNASPQWGIERDVTEYSPIFAQSSIGQASVYNIVNSQYTSTIYGRAELDFYPATKQYPPAQVADAVYPLSGGPSGGYVNLNKPTDQMTGTFTFPTNVEAAYLDVFLESQSTDEFWYTCMPNDLAQKLNNCGNTALREGLVTLDGQPAGAVPAYPWIYSGGIDPFLWVPIPGVETLNFVPYRIDLTPFAGQLDDGNPHTIAVSVFNVNNYFAANAALVVYQDHGSSVVTGRLVSDGTASAPNERTVEHVKSGPSGTSGTITTTATHPVSLNGYVITSKGRIDTRVTQHVRFSNVQKINVTSSQFLQDIVQKTTVDSDTLTTTKGHAARSHEQRTWPLTLNYDFVSTGTATATQTASVVQTKDEAGANARPWSLLNTVQSSDTLMFTPSGFTPSNGKSRQHYRSHERGRCYDETIKSLNYVLTGIMKGC
ncbi:MAG TPA: peptide-N4-asparagine amidase [Candidatus Cybelea sp.]|jgi:hypothetical protein|nr:peptide-N4-asparagine amidase [Candidatus Cybelea sp.]